MRTDQPAGRPSPATAPVPLREKILYGFGDVGSNFVWSFASAFLVLYYTDSALVAAGFVGSMMLLTRVFDAATDLMMGLVIEKTRTRFGKARPWLAFGSAPLVVALVATFNVPANLSETGKNVYVCATYFFMTAICYTAVNLSYHAMLARITLSQHERAVISAFRVVIALVAVLGLSFATPPLLEALGGSRDQAAWTGVSLLYAALGLTFLLACFFGTKEKVADLAAPGRPAGRTSIRPALKFLLRSRYFYLAVFLNVVMTVFNGAIGGYVYFARDVLGDVDLFGLLSACTLLPIIVVAPLMPPVFKRVGKRRSIVAGLAVCVAAGAVQLAFPYSAAVAVVAMSLRSAGLGPLMTASATFPGDIVDYMQWRTGVRAEGIVASIASFGAKLGTGLGSAMLGWFLAAGGYDGAAETQSQSAVNAEIAVVVAVPLAVCGLALLGMCFWDIDRFRPQIDRFLGQERPAAAH
ncbi:MAG: glycoside-pentoside-hexuronide (GPH):cation symporter [Bifidobacteriaceae bacterium]|jgi:GPH family glycoside/pentoside/hexuronide:cation symporter|nr:glycoside-pentoside-hexuronide (GPH):cation symporter [Bifidobacteriaceae bacterium]